MHSGIQNITFVIYWTPKTKIQPVQLKDHIFQTILDDRGVFPYQIRNYLPILSLYISFSFASTKRCHLISTIYNTIGFWSSDPVSWLVLRSDFECKK